MNTRELTIIALMTALICVAGPLSIAIGPIPLSLATFAVYLAGAVLGSKRGAISVALYLLIGAIGVPVFAGFTAGIPKLIGVTGGYLVGYLPCVVIVGLAEKLMGEKTAVWHFGLTMVAGTIVLYIIGTAWFMVQTHNPLGAALGMCVLPFLPGDAIKIVAASVVAIPVRKAALHK